MVQAWKLVSAVLLLKVSKMKDEVEAKMTQYLLHDSPNLKVCIITTLLRVEHITIDATAAFIPGANKLGNKLKLA